VVITAVHDDTGLLIGFGKVTRDLTEQKLAATVLLQQEQRFHLFVQAVQDYALFMLDPNGDVASWNRGAERIKGYEASEIIGRHFSCFYPEDVRNEKPMLALRIAKEFGRFEEEGWRLRKDGSRFWASVVITAVRDDAGELIGFGKVTRDLTTKMIAQTFLEEAQAKLSQSEASLRELSRHLLRTQDEERRRIGREIHDSLGQYLAALKLKLDLMSPVTSDINDCGALADECIKQVRTISYLLYPPMLEEMGLASAITWYLDGFSSRSKIKTTFRSSQDFGRLSRDAELALFRVLQESLTNVQRHSGSSTVEISISRDDVVELEVIDHGKGLPDAVRDEGTRDWMGSLGVGLRGMSERLRQIGGSLEVSSSSEGGTRVCATLPQAFPTDPKVEAAETKEP
jgi:PAS domain S-box-containing protein